ncbi:MAG: 6-deoxy-6-sulfo-D-gluconate dehydratase [Acidimicrobiales bacterium]|nr:MAG: dihydroxy-acid dehydratase [Actinomycetota bacterium]MBV6509332.1 6-deoxy-6-sulfo-D-gluconate dehydratase [Acidimicrobiales bacterium]RIK04641.1 MAG: dihydroxy-acid dehydratase [Acidobacteriota bacterium]
MALSDRSGIDRSLTAYGDPGFSRFIRRAFLASAGFDEDDLARPIIGIADTSSDYTTCHRQMPEVVAAVKRGVLEAGGAPLAFPTSSLPEILLSPTSMLYRNMLAMETEELIRAQPMDAVVLVGGCDKTVPAQLMAAVSADLPAISIVTGPMTAGHWRGERIGACTDCRRLWAEHRAGNLDDTEIDGIRDELCPTAGTCMVMGTASTMACLTEAMGLSLPGAASAPAPTGARLRLAAETGRCAVRLAEQQSRPSGVLSRASFLNALTVLVALGGSTNAVIHLLAIARRRGIPLDLADVGDIAGRTPLLVDCRPAGTGYLEDFDRAGGVPSLLVALGDLLDHDALTVTGETIGERITTADRPAGWQSSIRSLEEPLGPAGGLAVLRGSLAPDGALIKAAAASPELLVHRGPALVFDSLGEAEERLADPHLEATPAHVLVLRNAGPVAAGMPEAGSLPLPVGLARAGVRDMLRVSDARMSGTAYGTVVLHCAPEAAVGGPLGLVHDGDLIELDAAAGRLELHVDAAELSRRRAEWSPPPLPPRGWRRLYAQHVQQANLGCDLDFLGPEG